MKEKVLIIDDEIDFCSLMKGYFMKKSYEVWVAYTIQDGLFKLCDFNPDILVLDNNLPDGDGWEVVEKVVELFPHIKIFLISAHRDKASFTGDLSKVSIWEKPISLQLLDETF